MSMILAALALLVAQDAAPVEAALQLTPGTIAVRPPAAAPRGPSPDQPFADAVGDALTDAGFTNIPGVDHARYVATIAVKQAGRGAIRSNTPVGGPLVSGGPVGGGASAGPGGAVSIGLPTRASTVGELVETELTVSITERGRSDVVWEGHAVTHQIWGTAAGAPATVATKLARALFRNFPQPSGIKISVP